MKITYNLFTKNSFIENNLSKSNYKLTILLNFIIIIKNYDDINNSNEEKVKSIVALYK